MDDQALTPCIASAFDPRQAQLNLEQWQRKVGGSRATEKGWESGAASFMAYRMIGPYLSTVLEYYQRGKDHAGRHGMIWALFDNEENVKQVALEALFHLFGSVVSSHHYNGLAVSIAKRAEYVLWLNHPDMKGWHLEGLRLASSNDLGMKNIIARLRDKGFRKAESYQPLDRLGRTALGAFFIEAIVASTQMFSIERDYDSWGRKFKSVQATELYWDFLKRWKHNLFIFRHVHMPMIIPPKSYRNYDDGGYYSIQSGWVKIAWENYPAFTERMQPCVLGSLNKLQSCLLKLDTNQLSLIRWAWETGHEIGAVPTKERLPYVPYNDLLLKHGRVEAWRQVWKVKNDRRKDNMRSKIVNSLVAADRLKAHSGSLCWAWSADSRGRMYPRGSQLNFQGSDPHRSMILFGRGAPIKGNGREMEWAIGDALGLPASWERRSEWVNSNYNMIVAIGKSPEERLAEWAKAKKPWRFVQLCREMYRYLKDSSYMTHLPFQLDQTTSGYGHVACLTRDELLARHTNVIGYSPGDVYTLVADRAFALVTEQRCCGNDELTVKYLNWWLSNWPDRSLFKTAIMPVIYGRRYLSMQHEIADHLVAKFSHSQSPEGYQAMALAAVLSRQLLAAIEQRLPHVLALSQWLKKVGSGLIAKGTRPYWYTPNGLKIESYRSLGRKRSMRLVLSGRVVPIQVRDGAGEPLKATTTHLAADYVHSMDAAFLQQFVHGWQSEIITVHDCFATTLDRVSIMRGDLNKCFNQFYQRDYLYEYWKELEQHLPDLPPPPCFGELDTQRIGENPFLFT